MVVAADRRGVVVHHLRVPVADRNLELLTLAQGNTVLQDERHSQVCVSSTARIPTPLGDCLHSELVPVPDVVGVHAALLIRKGEVEVDGRHVLVVPVLLELVPRNILLVVLELLALAVILVRDFHPEVLNDTQLDPGDFELALLGVHDHLGLDLVLGSAHLLVHRHVHPDLLL